MNLGTARGIVAITIYWLALSSQAWSIDFDAGFSSGRKHEMVRLSGKQLGESIRFTTDGVIIDLKKDRADLEEIGMHTVFDVAGDFVIDLHYEIEGRESPLVSNPNGNKQGVGVFLCGIAGKDRFRFGNVLFPQDAGGKTSHFLAFSNDGKYTTLKYPTELNGGALRLERTGNDWTASISKDGIQFETIEEFQLSSEPITSLRIAAATDGSPVPLKLKLTKLSFVADDLPADEYFGPRKQRAKEGWSLTTWLLIASSILGVVCLAIIVKRRLSENK